MNEHLARRTKFFGGIIDAKKPLPPENPLLGNWFFCINKQCTQAQIEGEDVILDYRSASGQTDSTFRELLSKVIADKTDAKR